MTLVTQVLWPLVVLGVAAIGCYAFVRWLQRDYATVRGLRQELAETQRDWLQRFESLERQQNERVSALEKRVNALQPGMNPLGSHYSTRNAG